MTEIEIYEREICNQTGCDKEKKDSELERVKGIIDRIQKRGVQVKRIGVTDETTTERLPIIKVNGKIVVTGRYPSDVEFADWIGISPFPWHGSNGL